MNYQIFILLLSCCFSLSLCEISQVTKDKLLSDFINYYNIEHKNVKASEGLLQSISELDPSIYNVEVTLTVPEDSVTKQVKCTATVQDLGEQGISIVNDAKECSDLTQTVDESTESVEDTERTPVKLENEVQADTAITSGEQFIAIPRDQPSAPCIGCSSHVNPQAAGVEELANLAVRHLDLHEPAVNHSLDSVIDVERQVQIINGVRYILTLSINFSNCTDIEPDCISTKTCKVTVLVKPWEILPSGAKYRAILANNCTSEWLFGENGEVLPEPTESPNSNEKDGHSNGQIEKTQYEEVQAQPNQEKILTADEIKAIEEQIISYDLAHDDSNPIINKSSFGSSEIIKDHALKVESVQRFNDNSLVNQVRNEEKTNLSPDKKTAIDNMLDFFNFADFKPRAQNEASQRKKRQISGGPVDQNPDDAKYVSLAEESLQKYLIETGNPLPHEVVQINKVTTQVVAGTLTNINFVVMPTGNVNGDTINCFSRIWEKQWENFKQINVSCLTANLRTKTQITGGLSVEDPNDPKYLALAEESLQKYLGDTGNLQPHKVLQVYKVTTQVVAGWLTNINFVVTPTNSVNGGAINCFSRIWEKPWEHFKNINVSCQRVVRRIRRQVAGGETDQDPNDPKYLALAEESLQKYLGDTGNPQPHKVSRVEKVTYQPVAGSMTRIKFFGTSTNSAIGDSIYCTSAVWEKPWENFKNINVTCESLNKRTKRQVPGGETDQDPNDPKYLALAEESLQKYLGDTGNPQPHKVSRVEKVTYQPVAGSMTRIKFFGTSTNSAIGDSIYCTSAVWEKPWENFKNINVSCQRVVRRIRRQVAGGETDQDPNDPKYLALAEESLQKYLGDTGNPQPHKVSRVEKVTYQPVAGSMTRIKFFGTSTNSAIGDSIYCTSAVWEKPWENFKNINVSCQRVVRRIRRQVAGGETDQDPNDPKYLALAEESLQKYLGDTGNPQPHKVSRVEKVTYQPVAGSMTRIKFFGTSTNSAIGDSIYCTSAVWEKPWENFKNINVTCESLNKRTKRQVPGGETDQDPNDPKYLALAEESLQKYLGDTGNPQPHKVSRVEKVTYQPVAGSMTRIKFFGTSTNSAIGDSIYCTSAVWEKPWENFKNINVTCESLHKRTKRQVPGGETDQDPNDPKYLALAEESLQKYLGDTGNPQPHKVSRVEKVTYQPVAGSMTRIKFFGTSTNSAIGDSIYCTSAVWEKPWENFKNINVTCESLNKRTKRQVAGGETDQDPNDPKYLALAEESLQKYLGDTGNLQPHKVLQVYKVTTQVVAGWLTNINFVVTPTNSVNGGAINCFSRIWEKPWEHFKNINVSCQRVVRRIRRQVAGGETDQDPNDPKYLALAEESLQKYLGDIGNPQPHKVSRVEKVTYQAVAGSMTRIKFFGTSTNSAIGDSIYCTSAVWEKPWEHFKNINVACESLNKRTKRQVPGGETDQDPNDPKYLALAEESLQKYLGDTGNLQPHKVLQVYKVTTQVVAGWLTNINFVVTPTNSVNGGAINCFSRIWEKPWEHFKNINVSCQRVVRRIRRQVAGGETDQDPNDPKYLALAEESLQKYLGDTGNPQPHKVSRVEKVTYQPVAGSMTRIKFFGTSTNSAIGDSIYCTSAVWEKPWENFKNINVTCESLNKRTKRQVPGGETDQDPNDPKYLALAEESLQKYLGDTGNLQPHKVLQVYKVTTQVVAGRLTNINFVVTPTNSVNGGAINCFSRIWEKPWEHFKNINVSCQRVVRRIRRQVAGGETDQDPNDPKYLALAEESLQKYLGDTGNPQPHKVSRVEKVTTQVVAGSMTRIKFFGTSTNSAIGDSIYCTSAVWEKPWEHFKNINVACESLNKRTKRQVAGGEIDQDPNDPKYLALAEESLQKYLGDTGNPQPHKVSRVEKVTTQVVAGSMTRIKFFGTSTNSAIGDSIYCTSAVWEKPWENFKNINVTCESLNKRTKRQVPGGETDQDPNDPKYLALAEESLQKYLGDTGNPQPHKVSRVEKVTTQVVAGSMTRIKFFGTSTNSAIGDSIYCTSAVWEKPWEHFKNINVACESLNKRTKRQVAGGEIDQDPNDPKYLALAEESLQKYLGDTGNLQPHKVLQVYKVTTQVVAGWLTNINFVVTPTNSVNGGAINCFSRIWEKPWEHFKNINVSCQRVVRRIRRQVAGGETDQDPNDPKYLALAEESLQKYLGDTGNPQPHKVSRVEKVTYQPVAGSMTRIKFFGTSTNSAIGDSIYCTSAVWEKPWENFKNINVTCESLNKRTKRQVPGGETDQDPNDPKYLALAEESLQKYLGDTGNLQPHKVLQVYKVTTQVVAGWLTNINFVVTPTNSVNGGAINCFSRIWEKPLEHFKNINVSCQRVVRRIRRQVAGGETDQDPNDPKYLALAEESLQKYLGDTGNPQPHKVSRVEKVTTQAVAGSMTRIKFFGTSTNSAIGDSIYCTSAVWEKPWEHFKNINVACESLNKRTKRQVPGGETDQDPNDPKYLALAEESLQKYLGDTGNPQPHKVSRVEKVTTQVVAGSMTRIKFFGTSTNSAIGDSIYCTSAVWEKPWENFKNINVACESLNKRTKRQVPGGETDQDPNDPKYLALAEESLQKYLGDTGNLQPHKVLQVYKVTTQVVAGWLTNINFVVTPTNSVNGGAINCFSRIWEKPWEHFKNINVSCQRVVRRIRRQVAGGETDQDPNDPKYLALAEESLQKYLGDTGNPQPHKVSRVEKVTYQAVAGSMTRIKFFGTSTNSAIGDSIYCTSAVWEKPWEHFKNINVTCESLNKRTKRQVAGGETDQDPNDPKYLALAEESLQKYLGDTGNPQPHKVVRVEKVSTQVVAGSMTRIKFIVTPTNSAAGDTIYCASAVWEKPWENFKNIDVTCGILNKKAKRQRVGGPLDQDPNDPKYLALAQESLQKYLTDTGNPVPHKVLWVEKVTTQVVAGSMTRIKFVGTPTNIANGDTINCASAIWEKPWEKFKNINVTCGIVNKKAKRHRVGGPLDRDPNDPEYLALAQESLQKYLTDTGNPVPHKVVRVEKVTTQVVAGSLTNINFVITPVYNSNGDTINCFSRIWEKPWEHFKQINATCLFSNSRARRQVVGGEADQDPNDPAYLALAEESLQKYLADTSNPEPHKVLRVEKVTTQVVAGSLTKINFVVTRANSANGDTLFCSSRIWEKPWEHFKSINVTCQIVSQMVKIQVPGVRRLISGGVLVKDTNDPKYFALAQESLQRYLAESGISEPHKVLRIDKVTTQLVTGVLTNINFVAAPTNSANGDIIQCFSRVWEKSWERFKQINASCLIVKHRRKRQIAGGKIDQDPNDPKYLALANESLQKYLADTGNREPHKVVLVEKVTTQVVAGTSTNIIFDITPINNDHGDVIHCASEIWEKSWEKFKQIDVNCTGLQEKTITSRQKRELMQVNHYSKYDGKNVEKEQNVTKPKFQLLAAESLRKYSKKVGTHHKLLKVDHVTMRVVSGVIYHLEFSASPTECAPNVSEVRALACKVVSNTTLYCNAEIWEQAWMKKRKIDVTCDRSDEDDSNQVSENV